MTMLELLLDLTANQYGLDVEAEHCLNMEEMPTLRGLVNEALLTKCSDEEYGFSLDMVAPLIFQSQGVVTLDTRGWMTVVILLTMLGERGRDIAAHLVGQLDTLAIC